MHTYLHEYPEEHDSVNNDEGIRMETLPKTVIRSFRELAHFVFAQRQQSPEKRIPVNDTSDLSIWLHSRNIEATRDASGYYHLPISPDDRHSLPMGYGFKGGWARYLLRKAIHLSAPFPRDNDVVRISPEEPYPNADHDVSLKYMKDDYMHGDGVEVLRHNYFQTRDLTINEVLALTEEVIVSEKGLRDTIEGRLCITDYEARTYAGAGPKMRAKILRMLANETGSIVHDVDSLYNDIGSFWLALNLDRALSQGEEVAARYIEILHEYGFLPEHIRTHQGAAKYFMDDGIFFEFKHLDTSLISSIDEWDEEEELYKLQDVLHRKKR